MPINEMMQIRKIGDKKAIQRLFFVLNCALLLRKKVIGSILTIRKDEVDNIKEFLEGTGISLLYLYTRRNKISLYLYRRKELEEYLSDDNIKRFLYEFGYITDDIDIILKRLVLRFNQYESRDEEFPHEIGVFFGYPLEDVESYIENNGENALYVGYWKVYHNVENCMDIFKSYDEEKSNAVRELINGKTIEEIICI